MGCATWPAFSFIDPSLTSIDARRKMRKPSAATVLPRPSPNLSREAAATLMRATSPTIVIRRASSGKEDLPSSTGAGFDPAVHGSVEAPELPLDIGVRGNALPDTA